MGTDLNLPSVDSHRGQRATRMVLVGVAIVALVVAAAVIGRPAVSNEPYPDASGYIEGFYAGSDAAGMAEVIDARSLRNLPDAQVEGELVRILQPGTTVVDESTAPIGGVPVVQVTTADDVRWCVLPDGTILPLCRLGELPLSVVDDPRGFTLDEQFSGGDVFFDGVQLIVGLSLPADAGPVSLAGVPSVTTPEDAGLEVGQPFLSSAGAPPEPVQGEEVTIEPGSTLYLQLLAAGSDAAASLAGETVTVSWGDEELAFLVGRPSWYLQ